MAEIHSFKPLQFRSIWISDTHLGSKECRSDLLLDFLKSTKSEYLFLVGDIIDLWSMKKTMFWPQSHNNIVREILGKEKQNCKIFYIPGNHDVIFREHDGAEFGNLKFCNKYIHTTAIGEKYLILHGDIFDGAIRCGKFLELFGYYGYDLLLYINRWVNHIRNKFGYHYWSLATFLKKRVKNAMKHINNFENAAIVEAEKHQVHGIICGHIHHADIKQINNLRYCNDGDWVENCTALVEHHDGTLEIINWADIYNITHTSHSHSHLDSIVNQYAS